MKIFKCLLIRLASLCALIFAGGPAAYSAPASLHLEPLPGSKPRNVVFILIDDLRYDALGYMGHPYLETPHIDSIASAGVHLKNAFVTTSLCSPSRASVLTGQYAHKHKVVDNSNPFAPGSVFFSQYLQEAGYSTAFCGKWHMGGNDAPQSGFDHWVSFRGQGNYLADDQTLNVNGKRVPRKGYVTDELTDYAVDWLSSLPPDQPFMLYLSHKAVHAQFEPAERHKGRYKDQPFTPPATQADTPANYEGKPMWVRNQRNSWHGVDFPYHRDMDVASFYRDYCETLLAVDDSVGRVLDFLREKKLTDDTLVIFMGDNGFLFGEHGLIDKRNAYEESMRVPMVMQCPSLFKPGSTVDEMVANIDIAPTILEAAGLKAPDHMDGQSFLQLAQGRETPWRDALLYEYYWERTFPQTPTMFALRTDEYKYIYYHGIWDTDELYDLRSDPMEAKNLIRDAAYEKKVNQFQKRLFTVLKQTNGMSVPLQPPSGGSNNLRRRSGAQAADFPDQVMRGQ